MEDSPFRTRKSRKAAGDFERDGAHLFVDEAVGGEDDGAVELIGFPGEIADFAAGFFDEEDAGGDIPFVEAKFPEGIEAACGDAGEIERGGAIAAHSVRALGEVTIVLKIGAGFTIANGKAGAEETRRESGVFGDVHFFAVERGAIAASGGEELVGDGIEDDSSDNSVALGERDGNAEARIAVSEVGGAVERIDVPTEFRGGLFAGAFFGGDGMIGKILVEARDDGLLRALVGLGDDVDLVAFVAEIEGARHFFDKDLAGFLGDFDGGLEVVFGHGEDYRGVNAE